MQCFLVCIQQLLYMLCNFYDMKAYSQENYLQYKPSNNKYIYGYKAIVGHTLILTCVAYVENGWSIYITSWGDQHERGASKEHNEQNRRCLGFHLAVEFAERHVLIPNLYEILRWMMNTIDVLNRVRPWAIYIPGHSAQGRLSQFIIMTKINRYCTSVG